MKKILILLLLWVFPNAIIAQDCLVSEGIKEIELLNTTGVFIEALSKTEQLLLFKQITDQQQVELYIWEYKLHRNRLKTKKSKTALLKAITTLQKSGITSNLDIKLLLAEVYALSRDVINYDAIIKEIEAEVLNPSYSNTFNLGRYYMSKHYIIDGDQYPVERITYVHKALELFEKSNNVPAYYLGNVLRALGNLNRSNGDFDKSASFYNRELNIYKAIYKPDHFDISICNYNLGGVYYSKLEYQTALDHFLEAHKVWASVYESKNFRMRSLNEAIGDMYWELDNHEKALEYFNNAVIHEKKINNDLSEQTIIIADSLLQTGNYATAINYYEEAVKWRQKTYGKDHVLTGACKNFVARALRSSGDINASLDAYQEAIMILVKEMKDSSWYANPTMDMYIQSNQYLLEALMAKGELFKELYAQTYKIKDLKAALETQEIAIELLEKIKNNQMSSSSKVFWTNRTISLIESSIDTALQLKEQTGDKTYFARAFNFSERSKALLLLASLYDHEINSFANIPEAVITKERNLKQQINAYVGRIESEEKRCAEVRDKMLTLYVEKLQLLQNEYDLHINQIAQNYPEYYHLKYHLQIASLSDIQKQLLDDSTQLISYFSGVEHTYVFGVTNKDISLRKIENNTDLNQEVQHLFMLLSSQFQKSMSRQQTYNEYTEAAFSLYRKLLQPELAKTFLKKQLIIIPDGNLAYIPFEALLSKKAISEKRDYRSLPYLLQDFAVSYSQSASIGVLAKKGQKGTSNYYGFAPDYGNETNTKFRKKPIELIYNQPEVKNAAELFNGRSWTGTAVTEDLLKNNAGKAGILHLAMHGEVEDEHPLLSKLFFNYSDTEDGLLHTYEIYNLRIPAQLVILSACNTASGKLQRGEGILSLERAFQYAGSKSLMATLWTVDDAASSEITKLFLENLKAGKPKDIALQQAKRTFLKTANPEKLHPFYWSSFKLTGNTNPLEKGIKLYYYGIGIGIFTLFVAIALFRRKRKRNAA